MLLCVTCRLAGSLAPESTWLPSCLLSWLRWRGLCLCTTQRFCYVTSCILNNLLAFTSIFIWDFIQSCYCFQYYPSVLSDASSLGSYVLVEPLFFFWVHSYPVFWKNCLKRVTLNHHLSMSQSLRLVPIPAHILLHHQLEETFQKFIRRSILHPPRKQAVSLLFIHFSPP